MKYRAEKNKQIWDVPYLPIDPTDVGRAYEADVIRINSQSGKGGIGYVMETQYGLILPPKMREVFGYHVKSISDRAHRELMPDEVHSIFLKDFVNIETPVSIRNAVYTERDGGVLANMTISIDGKSVSVNSEGNGRLDSVSNALKAALGIDFVLESYTEHATEEKSTAKAASYVSISHGGKVFWGAGIDSDIIVSSVKALVSSFNLLISSK